MKKKFVISFMVAGLLALNFSPLITAVKAQTEPTKSGFSVSPPSFDITANPEDHIANTIKIENLSDQTLALTAKVQNFVAYGDEGQVNLTDEDSSYSINTWVKLEKESFKVKVGETKLFNFTLDIPKNTQPGSHYGAIVFGTDDKNTNTNAAKVVQEIGSIILIRVPGDVVEKVNLLNFASAQGTFTEPKINLDVLLQNTGTVLVKPVGTIVVTDLLGNTVQTVEVTSKNILPDSKRVFDQEFDFDKIGFFKAHLKLTYGETTQTIEADTSFISLYTQRLVPIVLVITGIILFYVIFRKRINKAVTVIAKG